MISVHIGPFILSIGKENPNLGIFTETHPLNIFFAKLKNAENKASLRNLVNLYGVTELEKMRAVYENAKARVAVSVSGGNSEDIALINGYESLEFYFKKFGTA
jgi:hypothetical protein